MKKMIVILLVLAFMAGCGPATVQELREKPAGTITFEVDSNYQTVYRRLITPIRENIRGFNRAINGDIYTNDQEAEISCIGTKRSIVPGGGVNNSVLLAIDIKAISDNRTKVTTYYTHHEWKSTALRVEQWCSELNSQ